MASSGGRRSVLTSGGLLASGMGGCVAWHQGLWGLLAGTVLTAIWLTVLARSSALRARRAEVRQPTAGAPTELPGHQLLLDAAPTPMLGVEGQNVRALNRAARRLFATDDRVTPPPPGLCGDGATRLRHEGRTWRIDRVRLGGAQNGPSVVALIDIEQEEHAAEARATAEMIQVLGHELLNGLSPIASLAESGMAAVSLPDPDPALLKEILGTLARRADGLQRFTEAYRTLARLPEPTLRAVSVPDLVEDLARLFASRCPDIGLSLEVADGPLWQLDRDQISQAIWALLQNAGDAVRTDGVADPRVVLATRHTEAGLVVEVGDNGPGVPPASASSIFRPFHTTKVDGTGVGLSLARQIAQAHGGTLTLERGLLTTFRMTLPARPAEPRVR